MQAARIFSIPPGADFLSTLARTFLDGDLVAGMSRETGPLGLAAATIYVPTRRAARALADVFVTQLGGTSALLPRLVPLGLPDDVETSAIFQDDADAFADDVPAAIGDVARRMILTRLVLQWGKAVERAIVAVDGRGERRCHESEAMLVATQPGDAWNLSGDLAGLIDELHIEGVAWRALEALAGGTHDEYWRITLDFLDIAMAAWPAILTERGEIDAAARRVLLIEREIARLQRGGFEGPLIVAGSTGTNRATARLMAAIARLPQGAVVLPGLDLGLDEASWNEVGAEGAAGHPQAAMRRLLPLLGVARDEVRELGRAADALALREAFLREALRPASTTALWQTRAERLADPAMAEALQGVALIEATDERLEALAIALVLREALETPERNAALITPERGLARRVIAELRRWDIVAEESAGVPLARSPAGGLARLALSCAIGGSQPGDVIALVSNACLRLGRERAGLRAIVEALEIGLLRGLEPPPGASLTERVAFGRKIAESPDAHRAHKAIDENTWQAIAALLGALDEALAPLAAITGEATVAEWTLAHRAAVLTVAADGRGGIDLPGEDGEALSALFDEVVAASDPQLRFDAQGYAAVFDRLALETPVHHRRADHPRIKILGLLEARLLTADVVVLGGLDEAIWPPQAHTDAFLNRPMRAELGLTAPERRIGQTAHDFVQAMAATGRVVMSRALKRGGAPTVASRLVQRMAAVAGPDLWRQARADGDRYLAWAQALGCAPKLERIEPPQPRPPLALRPKQLSVTRIEKLRRDPYAIFAELILKLKPMEPVAAPVGPREFGNRMHDILGRYSEAWPTHFLPLTAEHDLEMMAREIFADQFDDADFRTFQWPRIQRNLATYLRWERERRPQIDRIVCEKSGTWEIPLSSGEAFKLRAKADRIEIARDGRLSIIDFKTGRTPTNRQIAVGFSPQLTLEAAIAARGAFPGITAGREIAEGVYVRLASRGDEDPKPLSFGRGEPTFGEYAETHFNDLVEMLEEFALAQTPYLSRPYPQLSADVGDYDHLARAGEWGVGDSEPGSGDVSAPRAVPPHIRARQAQASDPGLSAWVSANAGSGKTFVLARRVIRLLLQGTPPAKLLCLTFTKAAAANMSARVFDVLAKWTQLSDEKLFAELQGTTGHAPSPQDLRTARQLFARTVETPGGLKIQTIHAFCERLLHVFPFEANVAARFEVVQDLRQSDMLVDARNAVLTAAMSGGASALHAAMQVLEVEAGAYGFDAMLRECIARRRDLRRLDLARHVAELQQIFGLRPDEADEAAIDRAIVHEGIAPHRWAGIARTLGKAETTTLLEQAANAHDDVFKCVAYVAVFLTRGGSLRAKLITKNMSKAAPELCAELEAEPPRILDLLARKRAVATVRRTEALLAVGRAVIDRYESAKARQGLLDFDDLIDKTLALLERSGAAWVMYKLDSGIDHILVDEAQDTPPPQWEILRRLAADFTAGEGARPRRRTFFAVGDEKQSIYSFQGAAPKKFDEMRRYFEGRIREAAAAGHGAPELAHVHLPLSFRTVASVLQAVDGVFATKDNFDGLSFEKGVSGTAHEAWKVGLPGRVEIWTPIQKQGTPDPENWKLPLDLPNQNDPAIVLADRVAATVRGWTAAGSPERVHDAHDQPRPVRAGDVLILVRTRGAVFEAVIRALKRHGVAVAGADRMVLTDHIAVLDLIAAGRAALLRDDDLSLACVLKSPLLGLGDDDLIKLAPRRRSRSLAAMIDADRTYAAVSQTLAEWRRMACALSPFDFYMRLLGGEGRRRFAARLGPEADDAIDEFLRRALEHERESAPSLPLFLGAMEAAAELEIKRDMEAVGDSVRVMTVHAAKGLEAKIVMLVDTCGLPDNRLDPKLFPLCRQGAIEGAPPLLAWSQRKGDDPPAVSLARELRKAEGLQEYRRLLYVAMTRAEERLVIAGCEGRPKKDGASSRPQGCWYDMISGALGASGRQEPSPWDDEESIVVFGETASAGDDRTVPEAGREVVETLPAWAQRPAAPERSPEPPLRPSNALAAADAVAPSGSFAWSDPQVRLVGRLAHTLLQQLPDVSAERRRPVATRFLAARAATLPADVVQKLIESILALISDPRVAPLFDGESRAEVAVAGSLKRRDGSMLQVNGRIDRLAVGADTVWIGDFKTGAAPAGGPPKAYVEQLALYRALVAPLYPGREVRAMLVWTQGPQISEVAASDLDGALGVLLMRRAA